MNELTDLQNALQDFMLRGEKRIEAQISGSARFPIETRLGIYANAYGVRLSAALVSNYPVLAQLMGRNEFALLARRYVRHYDSYVASIRWYGDALAAFLAADAQYRDAPVLADLAAWEWTMAAVFDAADGQPLEVATLEHVSPQSWAKLRFTMHPTLWRLDLAWNAPQIWKAVNDALPAPKPAVAAQPQAWLLWRSGLQVMFRSLDPVEAAALDAVIAGSTFGDVCAALCEQLGEADSPARAAVLLRGWVESGLILTALDV